MSRYRLERQSSRWTTFGRWWALGLWSDLFSAAQFMSVYDPDGTVRMRVWDIEQDEEVLMLRLKDIRQQPEPKVDWINCGF